jgi:hypothetical protein
MSHDLYFTRPGITQEQFTGYFGQRRHCQVTSRQCVYHNEDTGVYFLIDYEPQNDTDSETPESTESLSLNYCRPHFFGLEAAEEIAAFVEHFGLSIRDPQVDGVEDGPFSKEAFLKAWNHGNELGYAAFLDGEKPLEQVWTLPGARLEAAWRWNFARSRVQEALGEDRFVPRIFFMNVGGRAASIAVWPDAISELVPEVDYLFIQRDELAPKSFLGMRKKDQILVPFEQFKPALEPCHRTGHALAAYELPAPTVPEDLRAQVRALQPTGITGEAIAADQVLNEEIVARFRRR